MCVHIHILSFYFFKNFKTSFYSIRLGYRIPGSLRLTGTLILESLIGTYPRV